MSVAWNIATETDANGLREGNYIKGTVLLVLRKQTGSDTAYLDEINVDIKNEVKVQIESIQALDDKEEPNFSDTDYVLAAYAASKYEMDIPDSTDWEKCEFVLDKQEKRKELLQGW